MLFGVLLEPRGWSCRLFAEVGEGVGDGRAAEKDPRRVAWQEKHCGLYKAMLDLHDGDLIRIVHPANGERPDLMEATKAGHAALT
ncbi:hypothetical protein [Streptomyces sp. NPDC054804]